MFIDTHAHLNLAPLFDKWEDYLNFAVKAGVQKVIVPGTNYETSHKAIMMAKTHTNLMAAVGIHPEEYNEKITDELEKISLLTKDKHVVAIGEIGLDYKIENIEQQRWLFREQVSLAKENNLSVLVHTRRSQAIKDAYEDIKFVYGKQKFKGVFHCFTGSNSHYEMIHELGGFIGVGGLITYEYNHGLRKVIKNIPLDKIVLETDSPWLTPYPKQESFNQPANIVIIALKLAEVLDLPLSKVMQVTTNNALQLVIR